MRSSTPEIQHVLLTQGSVPRIRTRERDYFPMEVSFSGPTRGSVLYKVMSTARLARDAKKLTITFRGKSFDESPTLTRHDDAVFHYGFYSMLAEFDDGSVKTLVFEDKSFKFKPIGGTQ